MKAICLWLLCSLAAWGQLSPTWEPGTSAEGEAAHQILAADPMHRQLAEVLNRLLRFPRPLPVRYRQAGALNAWYNGSSHDVTISYDLAAFLHRRLGRAELTQDCMAFIVMHELGHALIHELDLPLVGREEDAADELATVVCAEALGERGRRMATNAASFFMLLGSQENELAKLELWDEHSLNRQRYYRILANLHAAHPDPAIERVVPVTRLLEARQRYPKKVETWNRLLAAHETTASGYPLQMVQVDLAREGHVTVQTAGPMATPDELKRIQMVHRLDRSFLLPANLTVVERETGMPRNVFLPLSGQIVLSREFFADARRRLGANQAVLDALQEFSLLQEFATALLSELKLPYTGDFEDAAAELTAILVAGDPSLRRLGGPMSGWYQTLARDHKNVLDLKYWSVAALDEQRYYDLLGYLYCEDPVGYPEAGHRIPAKRLRKIAYEYAAKKRNWGRLLSPFRSPGG